MAEPGPATDVIECPACKAVLPSQQGRTGGIVACPNCQMTYFSETKDRLLTTIAVQYWCEPTSDDAKPRYAWRFQGKKDWRKVGYMAWRILRFFVIIVGSVSLLALVLPTVMFWTSVVGTALVGVVYAGMRWSDLRYRWRRDGLPAGRGDTAAVSMLVAFMLCCCLVAGHGYLLLGTGEAGDVSAVGLRLLFALDNILSVLTFDIHAKLGLRLVTLQAEGILAKVVVAALRFFVGAGVIEWMVVWVKEACMAERFVATPNECWVRATSLSDKEADVIAEGRVIPFLNQPSMSIGEFGASIPDKGSKERWGGPGSTEPVGEWWKEMKCHFCGTPMVPRAATPDFPQCPKAPGNQMYCN